MDEPIQDAIDALMQVRNIHENQLWTKDLNSLNEAIRFLERMKLEGFK